MPSECLPSAITLPFECHPIESDAQSTLAVERTLERMRRAEVLKGAFDRWADSSDQVTIAHGLSRPSMAFG